MSLEYRVAWKRERGQWRYRRYTNLDPAVRLMALLLGNWEGAGIENLDGYYCCKGWECGCGGMTKRKFEEDRRRDIEKNAGGPVVSIRIDERPVGDWSVVETSPEDNRRKKAV